jgi:hypothetical protein
MVYKYNAKLIKLLVGLLIAFNLLLGAKSSNAGQHSEIDIVIEASLTSYQVNLLERQIVSAKAFMRDLKLTSQYPDEGKLTIVSNYLQFTAIQKELWGETISHSAFYDVESQQMVVYYDNDTQSLLQRVRHESIHMLLRSQYPEAPLWFHEGLAEFYEHINSQTSTTDFSVEPNSLVAFDQLLDNLALQTEIDVDFFHQSLQTISFLYNNRHQSEFAEVIHASITNKPASMHSIQTVNRSWLAQ